jgi:hypothetical protein
LSVIVTTDIIISEVLHQPACSHAIHEVVSVNRSLEPVVATIEMDSTDEAVTKINVVGEQVVDITSWLFRWVYTSARARIFCEPFVKICTKTQAIKDAFCIDETLTVGIVCCSEY